MSASVLPPWRRSSTRRAACVLAAMLPALVLQAAELDPSLPVRAGLLCAAALVAASALRLLPSGRAGRSTAAFDLVQALGAALLLATLWPPAAPAWMAALALTAALGAARALGGVAVNPFPPVVLALATGAALAQVAGASLAPDRMLVPDALRVSGVWLAGAFTLAGLGLLRVPSMLAFALPVAFAFAIGELPVASVVSAALTAGFVLGEPRHLPDTAQGRIAVAALAGIGTATAWLLGAPPVALGASVVLACALTPWIEHLTLPTRSARKRAS
jgi:Na+-translocating ferredoxin:NAD+ oxidoreductase RnfD subunit